MATTTRKILVVDNNPVFLGLMKSFLKKNGYQVWTAVNSLAALDTLKTVTPDTIFIDFIMPDIDGAKLCKKIREIPSVRKSFIILISAIAAEQDVDYFGLGFDACLAKGPFELMSPRIIRLLQSPEPPIQVVEKEGIYPREITKELLIIKHRLETTLTNISEAVLEVSEKDRILYVNPAAIRILGKSELELLASNFQELFKKGTKNKVKEAIYECNIGKFGAECDYELWNGHKVSINVSLVEEDPIKRIIVVRDLTEKRLAENELNFHRQFEKLVTEISTQFINMPSEQIENGILEALKKIGQFAGVDRSYIAQFTNNEQHVNRTHEWRARGIKAQDERFRHILIDEVFPWFSATIKRPGIVHVPDVAKLPKEAKAEKKQLEEAGIRSLIHVPMITGNAIRGLIGLETVKETKVWSEEMISLLRIVGEIFVNAINRAASDKALRESERKYRELADLLPLVVFETDTEGGLTFANRQAYHYFGDALLKKEKRSFLELVSQDDRTRAKASFHKIMADGESGHCQYSVQKQDGSVATMLIHVNAIRNHKGTIGIRGVANDITERKRWEDLYRTLAEQSFAGVYLLVDGHFRFVNAKFAEFMGYEPEELIDQKAIDMVHAEDRKATSKSAIAMLKGQRTSPYEFRIVMKNGTVRWAMETVSPVFYDGKRAILGNLMDLTERKTADEQLLYLSTHDSLTNLYNRAYFEAEVKRLEQGRKFPVNVLVADIDFLKETNDTLGHWAGDNLLRRTASVLRQVFRREDVVARIGGDEFSAIWTDSGQLSADAILTRIRKALTAHNRQYPDAPLSLSIGVATGPKGCNVNKLMREADKKMYEEKAMTRKIQHNHQIRRVK